MFALSKQNVFVAVNSFFIVLIVYTDMLFWITYGPSSVYQRFPLIYLIIIPLMMIIFSYAWKRLPKKRDE